MSSHASPPLVLEVGGRRADRRGVALLLALTVLVVAVAWLQGAALGLGLCLATAGVLGYGLWRARWFGVRRLSRIAWLADGRWELVDASGQVLEASLRGDTRVGSHYVWLRWNADVARSMLLFRGDLTEVELRRLIVRLRIQGLRPRQANESDQSRDS
jgi:hypothetical protein